VPDLDMQPFIDYFSQADTKSPSNFVSVTQSVIFYLLPYSNLDLLSIQEFIYSTNIHSAFGIGDTRSRKRETLDKYTKIYKSRGKLRKMVPVREKNSRGVFRLGSDLSEKSPGKKVSETSSQKTSSAFCNSSYVSDTGS
jgi:hypothetical protein